MSTAASWPGQREPVSAAERVGTSIAALSGQSVSMPGGGRDRAPDHAAPMTLRYIVIATFAGGTLIVVLAVSQLHEH